MGGMTTGLLLAGTVAAGLSLVDTVPAGPAALVNRFAEMGRTLDLHDPAAVRTAIGRVSGLPTRRSASSGFAGYTLPGGEIIFNPDLVDRTYLGVALGGCVSTATVRARLRGPEFLPPRSRTTVALYEDTPYRDRPDMAFSFHESVTGCVSSFGLAQRKPRA